MIAIVSIMMAFHLIELHFVTLLVFLFENLVMFLGTLIIIKKAAIINEFYNVHADLLKEVKDVLCDLLVFYERYFEEEEFKTESEILSIGKKKTTLLIIPLGIARISKYYLNDSKESKKQKITSHLNEIIFLIYFKTMILKT